MGINKKNEKGWASRFGHIFGIEGVKQSRRIELLPYLTGGINIKSKTEKKDPYSLSYQAFENIGADFKMGFGPNMTLDATINPDFGQIEADPAVVNLSEFESFFEALAAKGLFMQLNTIKFIGAIYILKCPQPQNLCSFK